VFDLAGGEGAVFRARHQRIGVVLVVLVEGSGAGRRHQHGERQHHELQRAEAGPAADGEAGQRGEGDDHADAQLEDSRDGAEAEAGSLGQRLFHKRHCRCGGFNLLESGLAAKPDSGRPRAGAREPWCDVS
jgi:hypothetical protein